MSNAKMLAKARQSIKEKLAERCEKRDKQMETVEGKKQDFAKLNADGADAEVRIAAKDNLQRQEALLKEFETDIAGWQNKLAEIEAEENRERDSQERDSVKRVLEAFQAELMNLKPELPSFIAAFDKGNEIKRRIAGLNAIRPNGAPVLDDARIPGRAPQEKQVLRRERETHWHYTDTKARTVGISVTDSPGLPGYGYLSTREGKPHRDSDLYQFSRHLVDKVTFNPADSGQRGELAVKWLADSIKGAVDCDTPEARRAFLERRIAAMKAGPPPLQRHEREEYVLVADAQQPVPEPEQKVQAVSASGTGIVSAASPDSRAQKAGPSVPSVPSRGRSLIGRRR